jgi:hypothetical protein
VFWSTEQLIGKIATARVAQSHQDDCNRQFREGTAANVVKTYVNVDVFLSML